MAKSWRIFSPSPQGQQQIAQALEITPFLAQILINRGINTPELARKFLDNQPEASSAPSNIKDLDLGVSRIMEAVRSGEKITVYGDYDADGITGAAILTLTMEKLGGLVEAYIPDRLKEGYGLNLEAVRKIAAGGTRLLVTVDCGTTALEEVALARQLGMDVIVVDHHEVLHEVAAPLALINPHQKNCSYYHDDLCGAGLAYKLCQGLFSFAGQPREAENYLDLAAVGTVADLVPLKGENRYLVAQGLKLLNRDTRPGFKALRDVAGISGEVVKSYHLGYMIGPRINAGGRIGDSSMGLRLMRCPVYEAALPLAQKLNDENRQRQDLEKKAVEQALVKVAPYLETKYKKAIVVSDDSWHPGIIGLVASRLTEKYCRPTLVVSFLLGDGKCSGRSVRGFDLTLALEECADKLVKFGGHEMAAGLTVTREGLEPFEKAFLGVVESRITQESLTPRLTVDVQVDLEDVNERLIQELNRLDPLGVDNPPPLLAAKGVKIMGTPRLVGGDKHVKFTVKSVGKILDAIAFRAGDRYGELYPGNYLDIAFSASINRWNGEQRVQLEIKDFRKAGL